MQSSVFRGSFLVAISLASLALSHRPAAALDDGKGNSLLDALDFVGLGEKKDQDVIFYRERAPLVLPPKNELRAPTPPVSERVSNWPKDPEAVHAAKLAEENRRRASDNPNDSHLAGQLTRQGRVAAADMVQPAGPGGPCSMTPDAIIRCDPNTYWKNLSVASAASKKQELQAGVEPDREYLTNPPKGYMAPTKNVAANSEPVKHDEENIFDYVRNKVGQ